MGDADEIRRNLEESRRRAADAERHAREAKQREAQRQEQRRLEAARRAASERRAGWRLP